MIKLNKTVIVKDVLLDIFKIGPTKNDVNHIIDSLDNRSFDNLKVIKKYFQELKKQKIVEVTLDVTKPRSITISFNGGRSAAKFNNEILKFKAKTMETGNHCPFCECEYVEGTGNFEFEGNGVYSDMYCTDEVCGETWRECYKMYDIITLKEGE